MDHQLLRLGIIGTGRIARRFVKECRFVEGIEITVVYNPHSGSAARFAEDAREGMEDDSWRPRPYDTMDDIWELVDAVYIATPHETHYEYITEALKNGKHVLCEKPMCLSLEEAVSAMDMARAKNLVLMEAIKTSYCPGFYELLRVLENGTIGQVRYVDACFTKLVDPCGRELTDRKYGGSFPELGSYVMLPMLMILGSDYHAFRFESIKNALGLDIFTKADFRYRDALATLTCGLGVKSEGRLLIAGETGYIVAEAPWWKLSHFEAHFEDTSRVVSRDCVFEADGLRYELSHFVDRVQGKKEKGRTEDCSIVMADIMGKFLRQRNAVL